MKIKTLFAALIVAFLTASTLPTFAGNPGDEVPKEVRAKQIEARIFEIKRMDKSNLTQEQKQELRKEVKNLRKESKRKGIYLSVGAIIIILLLLILILK